MRRLTLLLVAPLAAILLTGCVRVEIVVRVADDGSGMISFLTAIDSSAMNAFGALDPGADDVTSSFTEVDESSLPEGATAEPYEEGTFVGSRVMIPFAASGDVAGTISGLVGDAGAFAGPDGMFERFVLEGDDDGWRFEAQFPRDMMGDMAGGGDALDLDPALLAPLLGEASFIVRVALPGTVVEHNADRVEADELIWDLEVLDPGARTMMARTELGGEGTSPVLVAAVAVAVVAAAAGGVWAVRRRRAA